jgi:fatty-acid peroxygenase
MSDLALELFRHGYGALPRLWATYADDARYAQTTLLGHRAHVVRGHEGGRLFYDESVVQRAGAVPAPLRLVLFGRGAVHGLDGSQHRERKRLFLDVLTEERVAALGEDVARELAEHVHSWPGRVPFRMFDELVRVYGTCVLPWAGVHVEPREAATVAARLARIVDGFGLEPRAYPRAVVARWKVERWARRLVREVRAGRRSAPTGSMLAAVATGAGAGLSVEVAAVELINVLRPTVAVAWFGCFAAMRLVVDAEARPPMSGPGAAEARAHFGEEVRRTTPFAPALVGRVRRPLDWSGHRIDAGDLLVLDVPGTHHVSWPDPDTFRPSRFAERTPGPFEHLPQGGGDPRHGHRCPGELVTMTLLDRTVEQLASIGFTVSTSDPDLARIPTLPGDRLLVVDVRAPGLAAAAR